MSRQLDAIQEIRTKKRQISIVKAVEFELIGAVGHSGAELRGFSVRLGDGEVLMTLRARLAGRRQVCFVGAEDLGSCMLKCVRAGLTDNLHWREDKFG